MSIILNYAFFISGIQIEAGRTIWNLLSCTIIIILGLLTVLFINIKKRTKAESAAKLAQERLQESYVELEKVYKEVTLTQQVLNVKFQELKQSEAKNKKLAYTDYLTELPNRTAFTSVLENELYNLKKNDELAIMYIDLDNFKVINDTLGHTYGDELLIDVSHRLREVLESNDYLARFGGDEFIVLTRAPGNTSEYEEKIKRIMKVFSYPFVLATKEFFITVSIGIVSAPKDGDSRQILIKNVDSAMYVAKELGKNTYYYFDETVNKKLMYRIELQSALRKAMEKQEFEIYYQPQVELKTDRIIGFEALVRWNHPEKGIVPPSEFISIAEETGLIVQIGQWVLYESCEQIKRWENMGFLDLKISVNFSVRQFKDADIVEMVMDAITKTQIDPTQLDIEITESMALEDIDYTIETIEALRKIGVCFSLDDFGTGYSSMSYLNKLPVENLKIDKSFLKSMLDNKNDQKIVTAIIELAQILDLAVVAEGVESADQVQFLKDANCDKAQGYLYSKPLPTLEASRLLEQNYTNILTAVL